MARKNNNEIINLRLVSGIKRSVRGWQHFVVSSVDLPLPAISSLPFVLVVVILPATVIVIVVIVMKSFLPQRCGILEFGRISLFYGQRQNRTRACTDKVLSCC